MLSCRRLGLNPLRPGRQSNTTAVRPRMRGPLVELLQYGDDEEVQHGRSVEQVLCSFV